jgi:hypothetical protein
VSVQILLGSDVANAVFPESVDGQYARRWLTPFATRGPSAFITNIDCRMGALVGKEFVLPLTITDPATRGNAYVVSPFTHYVSYLEEELRLVGARPLRKLLELVVRGLGAVLSRGEIDRVVIANNWMLSTNLYPALGEGDLRAARDAMLAAFPQHALMFRSLNQVTTPHVMSALIELGFTPMVSRRVYMFDAHSPALFRRRAYRQDSALFAKRGYRVEAFEQVTKEQAARIVALYNALYLDKYSRYNPGFTEEFVTLAVKEKLLYVYGLMHGERMDGVVGFFVRQGVMTTPLLGYDMSFPVDTGLYRMLTTVLSDQARERGLFLHQSSGAATFKRSRGAEPAFEYSMVYTRHLSPRRRAPWEMLSAIIEHLGKPMMEKYDR